MPCAQESMAEALAELEVHNISTAPKFGISYSSLKDAATSQAACEHLFEQMKDAVGQSPHTLLQPTFTMHAPPVKTPSSGVCGCNELQADHRWGYEREAGICSTDT